MTKHCHTKSARSENQIAINHSLATTAPGVQPLAREESIHKRVDQSQPKLRSTTRLVRPGELNSLISVAGPAVVTALTIAAFAGLRVAELLTLTWADVRLDEGRILVSGDGRFVTIPQNLAALLRTSARRDGKVTGALDLQAGIHGSAIATGISCPFTALRLSFVAYRAALTGNWRGAVSEAGIDLTYLPEWRPANVLKAQAQEWFSLVPSSSRA